MPSGREARRRRPRLALRFDADAAEAVLRFAWPLNLRGVERLVHELGSSARAALITPRAYPRG